MHDHDTARGVSSQSAAEEGWHVSRYTIAARIPDDGQGRYAVTNLYRGNFGVCPPLELAALAMLDELPTTHPAVERLIRRGLVVNFDERAAVQALARNACASGGHVALTICPTMGCNFDCPYCFEEHGGGPMTREVQDDVVALAGRMMDAAAAKRVSVVWFGGEPLLAPHVVEALSERLYARAEERGAIYRAKMVTNGYLLTPDTVDMLERARVAEVQVTLDGLGAAHDATRHLAGGGATFERIVENLSRPGLPFLVSVRHNVHEGNRGEVEALRDFVEKLAATSGNKIYYYPALVIDTETAERRGCQVGIADESTAADVLLSRAPHATGIHPLHCGAGRVFDVGVDPKGRLHKCWEAVDKPELSFGDVRDWDPADPIATADQPDNLIRFVNCALPLGDAECDECLWLPLCAGGCPYERLFNGTRACVPYRNDPERYALAFWHAQAKEPASTTR